jgi:hypothetical protein
MDSDEFLSIVEGLTIKTRWPFEATSEVRRDVVESETLALAAIARRQLRSDLRWH